MLAGRWTPMANGALCLSTMVNPALDVNYVFALLNSTLGTFILCSTRGRRSRDRMVVQFTTTYVISAYHY